MQKKCVYIGNRAVAYRANALLDNISPICYNKTVKFACHSGQFSVTLRITENRPLCSSLIIVLKEPTNEYDQTIRNMVLQPL